MTSSRKTALTVGVLFILTFITSIAAVFAYGPVLTDPAYILSANPDTGVFMGAFLELLLIITNIGCAVVCSRCSSGRTRASPSGTSRLVSSNAASSPSASSAS